MKSYLLSALRQTFNEEEFRAFARSNGHHWLLWEPGGWTPAKRNHGTAEFNKELTEPTPNKGEALALVLPPKAPEDQLTLGRSAACDLTINDGTLSQTHLIFTKGGAGWMVRDAGSTNGSWLNGKKLDAGTPAPLANGSRIQAAQVHLTHYDPEGLWERLKG